MAALKVLRSGLLASAWDPISVAMLANEPGPVGTWFL